VDGAEAAGAEATVSALSPDTDPNQARPHASMIARHTRD
jgi:hypothetical protein